MDTEHYDRCDLLRSYFQQINPHSIPCTYKANFEASSIYSLLTDKGQENAPTNKAGESDKCRRNCSYPTKVFGPWRSCCCSVGLNTATSNTSTSSTLQRTVMAMSPKKGSRSLSATSHRRMQSVFTRASSSEIPKLRYNRDPFKNSKHFTDDPFKSISAVPPIPYHFRFHENSQQYIRDYRNQYTNCRLQEANHGRHIAARLRIHAYEFRRGLLGLLPNANSGSNTTGVSRQHVNLNTINLSLSPSEDTREMTSSPCRLRVVAAPATSRNAILCGSKPSTSRSLGAVSKKACAANTKVKHVHSGWSSAFFSVTYIALS